MFQRAVVRSFGYSPYTHSRAYLAAVIPVHGGSNWALIWPLTTAGVQIWQLGLARPEQAHAPVGRVHSPQNAEF